MDPILRKRIIVSADDFGISALSSERILELIDLGKVDRTAVMMDGDGSLTKEQAQKLISTGVKTDIHLNSVKKITPDRRLQEPIFPRLANFFWRIAIARSISAETIERGWRKEIQDFEKMFGRIPDGISAHEYIYFFPAYFAVTVKLANEFDIPSIRFGKQGMIKSKSNVFRILNTLRKKNLNKFISSKLDSTDFWVSLDWFSSVPDLLKNIPNGTTEVVIHPERDEEWRAVKKYF
jgi:predicted glycoside hydrolase/deacetylase ChbG (UPF0249 family)